MLPVLRGLVRFHRAALQPHGLFELALHRVEGVAQRDVDVLVMVAIDDDLFPGHPHVHADLELPALVMMLLHLLD